MRKRGDLFTIRFDKRKNSVMPSASRSRMGRNQRALGVPFANGTPRALWLRPIRERDAEGITLFFRLSNLIVKRSPLFLMDNYTV